MSAPAATIFQTPYGDTTGNLTFIPVALTPAHGGGYAVPTAVGTMPTWTVNGVTLTGANVPQLLTLNTLLSAVVFRMIATINPGDVVTMAAPQGWATCSTGQIGGTSGAGPGPTGDGTAGAPVTVTNNSGASLESLFVIPSNQRTMKLGYLTSTKPFGNGAPCHLAANWFPRCINWGPAPLQFWPDLTPQTIAGNNVHALFADMTGIGHANSVDGLQYPVDLGDINHPYILTFDDTTPGVTSSAPMLSATFDTTQASATAHPTIISTGTWDGTAWRGIKVAAYYTVSVVGFSCDPRVVFTTTNVVNGIGTLRISNATLTCPGNAPVTTGNTQIDDQIWAKTSKSYGNRNNEGGGQNDYDGMSNLAALSEINIKTASDAVWGIKNPTTVTIAITACSPVTYPLTCLSDAYGTLTWSDTTKIQLDNRLAVLFTTLTPHNLSTGAQRMELVSWPGAQPRPNVDHSRSPAWTLASNVLIGDAVINITPTAQAGLSPSGFQIDSEQFTISGPIVGGAVPVNRGALGSTAAAHSAGTPVYALVYPVFEFLIPWVVDSHSFVAYPSGPTGLIGAGIAGMVSAVNMIPSVNPLTSVTATAFTMTFNGTIAGGAGNALSGFPVQIAGFSNAGNNGVFECMTSSATQIVVDVAGGTTEVHAATASTGWPCLQLQKPAQPVGVPFELLAAHAAKLALANGESVCWVPIPVNGSDALVTGIMTQMICPNINAGVKLVVQLGNELWSQTAMLEYLETVASVMPLNPPYTDGGHHFGPQQAAIIRQAQVIVLAKAAMVAAGLPPGNVFNAYGGWMVSGTYNALSLGFMQANQLPIDLLPLAWYDDCYMGATFNTWLPPTGFYTQTMARAMMISYNRSVAWWGILNAGVVAQVASQLAMYNAGLQVSSTYVTTWQNTGLGRICYYEFAWEDMVYGVTNWAAMSHDMVYDPLFFQAETCHNNAAEKAGYLFAQTFPSSTFPPNNTVGQDHAEAFPHHAMVYGLMTIYGNDGTTNSRPWTTYTWRSQLAGPGDGTDGQPPNQFSWAQSGAMVSHESVNESVRGYAHQAWQQSMLPYAGPPTPSVPTPKAKRWFPTLGKRRF